MRIPKGFIEVTRAGKEAERTVIAVGQIEAIYTLDGRTKIAFISTDYLEVKESVDEVLGLINEEQEEQDAQ